MTVKEIVTLAAEELRIATEVTAYLDGSDDGGKEKTELLLTCFNLVENELALDYLPLQAEDEMYSSTGQITFDKLKNSAVRILEVRDVWGNKLAFKLYPKYLTTQPGTVSVVYTYTPAKKTAEDDCDFGGQVSARLMAYGIAAEYTMAMGAFEESALWDKKYKDAVEAAYQAKPCVRMASRRWV